MPFQCRPVSDFRSRMEEAERPKPVPLADENPAVAHPYPQPAQAEGRSHGTRTAPLSAREVRSARRRRQVARSRLVNQSRARFPRESFQQPAPGSRSRTALLGSVRCSALGSARVDRSSLAAERLAAADIRTPTAPPYPHDRVVRTETRAGRLL